MLAASLIAIFLIPVSFYVVETPRAPRRGAARRRRPARRPGAGRRRPRSERGPDARRRARGRSSRSACAIGPTTSARSCRRRRRFATQRPRRESIADLPWWEVFRDDALGGADARGAREQPRSLAAAVARRAGARARRRAARRALPAGRLRGRRDARQGHRSSAARSPGSRHANDFLAALEPRLGDRRLGPHPPRERGGARGDARDRGGAARRRALAGDGRRAGLLRAARARPRARDRAQQRWRRSSETRDLFQRQFTGGVASKLDALRGEAALAQAAATVPALEQRSSPRRTSSRCCSGASRRPIPRGAALVEQTAAARASPPACPSQLLERRPDLIEAEETLRRRQRARRRGARRASSRASASPSVLGSASNELSDRSSQSGHRLLGARRPGRRAALHVRAQTWYALARPRRPRHRRGARRLRAVGARSRSRRSRTRSSRAQKLARGARAAGAAVTRCSSRLRIAQHALPRRARDLPRGARRAAAALPRGARPRAARSSTSWLALVALYRALGGGWAQSPEPPSVPQPIAP